MSDFLNSTQDQALQDAGKTNLENSVLNGQADAAPQVSLKFGNDNADTLLNISKACTDKHTLLERTFLPLCEAALIELFGMSSMYKRESLTIQPILEGENVSVSFTIVYFIQRYIQSDAKQEDIAADAQYVYKRIEPSKVQVSQCKLSAEDGHLTIAGVL